jgi:hypothetical protein
MFRYLHAFALVILIREAEALCMMPNKAAHTSLVQVLNPVVVLAFRSMVE